MKKLILSLFLILTCFTAIAQSDQIPTGATAPLLSAFLLKNINDTASRELYLNYGKSAGILRSDRIPRYSELSKIGLQQVTNSNHITTKPIISLDHQQAGDSTKYRQLIALGSSLTKAYPDNGATRSDTVGYGLKVAAALGYQFINLGLSGRKAQQFTVGDSSIYDTRATIPNYSYPGSLLVLEMPVNDVMNDTTKYTTALFTTQISAVVDFAVTSRGWPVSNIVLFNPSYYSQATIVNHGSIPYRHSIYNAAMSSIAATKGCLFYDGWDSMKAANNLTHDYVYSDSLHMTPKGQSLAAANLIAYLTPFVTVQDIKYLAQKKSVVYGSQSVLGTAIDKNLVVNNNAVFNNTTTNGPASFNGDINANFNVNQTNPGKFLWGSNQNNATIGINSRKQGTIWGYTWAGLSTQYIFYDALNATNTFLNIGAIANTPGTTDTRFYNSATPTTGAIQTGQIFPSGGVQFSAGGTYTDPGAGFYKIVGTIYDASSNAHDLGLSTNLYRKIYTTSLLLNGATASTPLFTDASKNVVSTGIVTVANGGTGQSTLTTGDMWYASGTNTNGKLAIGSSGQVLTVVGGAPTWQTPSGAVGIDAVSQTNPLNWGGVAPAVNSVYRVGGYININSVTADVVQLQVQYTDIHGVLRVVDIGPGYGAVGNSAISPIEIQAKSGPGLTVQMQTALTTSGGSVNYDTGFTIQQIR